MKRAIPVPAVTIASLLVATGQAEAHVRYVSDSDGAGSIVPFLGTVLSEPQNVALLSIGFLTAVAVAVWHIRAQPFDPDLEALRTALSEYERFLPWMVRLSLGLPLVGAGFAGYLFTPAVEVSARLLQVAIGFLLLFGLATRAVAAAGLLVYLVALTLHPPLVLAVEYVGGFLAIIVLGAGRPSADHLLREVASTPGTLYGRVDPVHRVAARFESIVVPYRKYAPVAVRGTLGVGFVYLGFWEKLAHPNRALAVVAKYDLTSLVAVDPGLWVVGAALVEIGVGLLLLFGFFTRAAAAAAFLTLVLTLFGLPDDPVLAHVTLFGLTSMLFVTGSGPLSLDDRLRDVASAGRRVVSGVPSSGR